ncbi:MAG: transcriptional repressor LexA [Spirochaetia bacterium]
MKKLTDRQEQVLHFIAAFLGQHHYPPTIREIAKNFEISVKGAYDHVKALEKKEKIICNMNRSRAIEIVGQSDGRGEEEFVSIPVLGNVAAGTPLFAEENLDGTIKLPVTMLKSGPHFALRVKGDSMQDAGIMSGDIAVFRQQNIADNGTIVVAMVNEAVTLKRFFKEKNRVKLKAENPVYPPIYTTNIQILGKLLCVFRYYED